MNLGPDGAAALAKRWANVDSATAGYVARLWLGAQKKWDRVSADGIFSVLNAFQVSEARDAAIQAIPGAAYERMDSDFIAAILSLVSAHGNNHWGRKIYAAIPGDAWKRIGHADMATLVRRWASVDSATAGYVMRLWIAAQSAAK